MKPIFSDRLSLFFFDWNSLDKVLFLGWCPAPFKLFLRKRITHSLCQRTKKIISKLCVEYQKKDSDEVEMMEVLVSYGFNEKDAQSVFRQISKQTASCRIAVNKQCDLIMLRNGVGY